MTTRDARFVHSIFAEIARSSPDPISAFDRDGFFFANEPFQRIYATLRQQRLRPGMSISEAFDGDLRHAFERTLSGERVQLSQRIEVAKTAIYYQVMFTPVFRETGPNEVIGGICIWHDRTDQFRAEQNLAHLLRQAETVSEKAERAKKAREESENKFHIVAENARAVFGIVQGRHFVYVNRYLSELSGYSKEEILAMDIAELIHPDFRARVLDYAARRQAGGAAPDHYQFAMVTKAGETRWLDFSPAPITYNGQPAVVGTAFDVTDRKRAQEMLIQSEKLASVGRMAATIAHEINNPLAAVMNCIFLARNTSDPGSLQRFLDTADDELRRIALLTQQALGFYREPSTPTVVSTEQVMESAISLLKSKIKAKHVRITKEYEEHSEVIAIAGELRQVFTNLLANSLEAVQERGAIRLRISTHPQRETQGNRSVRITVSDDGAGISDAVRPRIFEPLFTTRIGVGTGLGLWVSLEIVDKHHGTIRVHSRTEGARRGTTFSILLPAA